MRRRPGSKERIRQFLLAHIGEVVTSQDIQEAVGPEVTEWARRLRELRNDEGWPIRSHHDDSSLRPWEYRMDGPPPERGEYVFSSPISARMRAQVLERNGYTCQMCGAGAGDPDDLHPGRKVRLHIGHIQDRIHGGPVTLANLRALCSTCNQGAKDMVQEPPSWSWLLGQIRRAPEDTQRRVMEWLQRKFRREDGKR